METESSENSHFSGKNSQDVEDLHSLLEEWEGSKSLIPSLGIFKIQYQSVKGRSYPLG